MHLSHAALNLTPSEPRRIYEEAKKYRNVIDLTLGDPDLPPPMNVRAAACMAIMDGSTRYSANAGLLSLRQAIADDFRSDYGESVDPQSEVIVTVGAMEASYLSLWSLLDKGDEAILPMPYWINYSEVIKSLGAVPVFIENKQENGFVLRPDDVERAITPRTRLLILNSPANPTGAVIPGDVLDNLAAIAVKHDIAVLSDDIYSHLVFDGQRAESIITRPGMRERTIVINGASKRFAMTGWRLGWAIGPAQLVSRMTQMTENIVACAPLPAQYAAIEALSPRTDESYILDEFQRRRDCVLAELAQTPKITCIGIPATFYAFLDVSQTGMSGQEFVMQLLREKQVAMVHGSAYGGDAYRNFVRIAFTMDCVKIHQAFARIRDFLSAH